MKNQRPTIVLLHALGKTPESLSTLQGTLQQHFPQASIITPEEPHTRERPIEEQADTLLAQLQTTHNVAKNQALLLVGHSQGGLRAHALLRKHSHLLHICAIATIGTPWEGAPVTICPKEVIQDFITLIRNSRLTQWMNWLHSLGLKFVPYAPVEQMADAFENTFERVRDDFYAGITDIKPKSPFLQVTAQHLTTNTTPILAIAGGPSGFLDSTSIDGQSRKLLEPLLKTYTELFGKIVGHPAHDLLIPVYSQLAQHLAPQRNTFLRCPIPGVVHDHLQGIKLKNAAVEHPKVLAEVVTFARQQWNNVLHERIVLPA